MHNQAMARQRGVATLVVSVGVALLMAVAAVGMMRSGLLEQKIAANDLRAREAQEIAQAGLESIMISSYVPTQACMKDTNNVLDLKDDKLGSFDGVPSVPNSQTQQTSKEGYIHSIKGCKFEGRYFARSEVKLNAEPVKTEYFVEAWFQRSSLLNSDVGVLSPFFINGKFCMSEGNEKCKPKSGKILDSINRPGVIATGDINGDTENNIFSQYQASSPEKNPGVLNGKSSAWNYIFSITLDAAKEKANKNLNDGLFYVQDKIDKNYGSLQSPVVLIVGKENSTDCYKINGGVEIYGVVYLDGGCKINGWGNAKIYGSLVSDSDIVGLSENSAEYHGFSSNSWNALKEISSDGVFVIPGTWKDF